MAVVFSLLFFFFNDTATTEIYTLSLHDALPIFFRRSEALIFVRLHRPLDDFVEPLRYVRDRKSTRLNSSHLVISYAVFCLKKKKTTPPERKSHINRTNIAYTTSPYDWTCLVNLI